MVKVLQVLQSRVPPLASLWWKWILWVGGQTHTRCQVAQHPITSRFHREGRTFFSIFFWSFAALRFLRRVSPIKVSVQPFCAEISGSVSKERAHVCGSSLAPPRDADWWRRSQWRNKTKNKRPIQTPKPHLRCVLALQPITGPTRSLCDMWQWWRWPCPPCWV